MKKTFSLLISCILLMATFDLNAQVSFDVSITADIAPPPLPFYVQPPCPEDGLMWIPGYWASDDDDYYWVPGVWVSPPDEGYLWTPCYWGYERGIYAWHPGYWGIRVGFYGGVNYGYGYCGTGFVGGRWEEGGFSYNAAVMNVNTTIVHNTYINQEVINNNTITYSRTSFNGGPGGISARPTGLEQSAMRQPHFQPTNEQVSHQQLMRHERNQFASINHGRPTTAAMNYVNGNRYNPQGHQTPSNSFRSSSYSNPVNRPEQLTSSENSRIRPTTQYSRQQQNTFRQQQFNQPRAAEQPTTRQQQINQQREVQQQYAFRHQNLNQQREAQQQNTFRQQQFNQPRAAEQLTARQQQFNQQRAEPQQMVRQQQWERPASARPQQSFPQRDNRH